MDALNRPCRRCGRRNWMRPSTRFDRETCSDRCRKAISRGADLEYLRTLPDDQARTRRFLHEAIRDEIAVERLVRAQRRDYRATAKRKRLLAPSAPPRPPAAPAASPEPPAPFFVKVP